MEIVCSGSMRHRHAYHYSILTCKTVLKREKMSRPISNKIIFQERIFFYDPSNFDGSFKLLKCFEKHRQFAQSKYYEYPTIIIKHFFIFKKYFFTLILLVKFSLLYELVKDLKIG